MDRAFSGRVVGADHVRPAIGGRIPTSRPAGTFLPRPKMIPQLPHAAHDEPGSDDLKNILRGIFDSQILNYGDYNLIFAVNARREGRDADGARISKPRCYVIGYRWQPTEIMVAPVNGQTLTGGGVPVELNMTNLAHAVQLADGDYEVATNTGRTFRFGVKPDTIFQPAPQKELHLEQADDYVDFELFMQTFIALA
ncbi:hypothetical protein GCM10027404_05950 [Arthrobacter tumbae]|uniref:hypothetical protein n=1 Tax=Arthrobacter tumbae TaxID=163874 RepID=UPI001EF883B5|nr:hypothetical protein [Arthrobacter tumbae]MBM7779962.1 hypothetical protein [Arthrobacter tumbae]